MITLAVLQWYRAFIRSGKQFARDPESRYDSKIISRESAQMRLTYLVDVAVNRRGGTWPEGKQLPPRVGSGLTTGPGFVSAGLAPINHRGGTFRKFDTDFQVQVYRDAQRLSGYGGFGREIERPEIAARLGATHVHAYADGRVELCAGEECRR